MIKLVQRWWKYLTAKLSGSFNERADPKVQLEQAITEAQDQHRRLREQAANVIANQKQTELRLNRALEEMEKVGANTRQALVMADAADKAGDAKKAGEMNAAAESFATRMIQLEHEVDDLKALHFQSTQAADQAKAAVEANATALQQKIQVRYAKAMAKAELSEASVESRVLEVEQATANVEAQSRLSELRAELVLLPA